MSESTKTSIYVAVAVVLMGLAFLTRSTTQRDPEIFNDTGTEFFPDFTDPAKPKALEVISYNTDLAQLDQFRVQFKDGRWTIPSHNDYPADAQDRLKRTAAWLIGLKKAAIASDKKADHVDLGVVNPEDSQSTSKGLGTRVKLLDENNNPLVDMIVGKEVEGKTGLRYVRLPSLDRVYLADLKDGDLSTRFIDWIDTNLLDTQAFKLDAVTIKDYQIVPRGDGQVAIREQKDIVLTKDKASNKWKLTDLAANEKLAEDKADGLASSLVDLKIAGVRPKPPGLSPDLRRIQGQQFAINLMRRGFYPTEDGRVVASDGEVITSTEDGLVYTLRFGGEFVAKGEALTAGTQDEKAEESGKKAPDAKDQSKSNEGDNKTEGGKDNLSRFRFLLVSVGFDESKIPAVEPVPADFGSGAPPPAGANVPPLPGASGMDALVDDKPTAPSAPPVPAAPATKPAEAGPATSQPASPTPGAEPPKNVDPEVEKKFKEHQEKLRKDEEDRRKKERETKVKEGKERADKLAKRYANWFYVISNDNYSKVRLSRKDLIAPPEKKEEQPAADPALGPITPPVPALPSSGATPTAPTPEPKAAVVAPAATDPKAADAKPADAKATPVPAAPKETPKPVETPKTNPDAGKKS